MEVESCAEVEISVELEFCHVEAEFCAKVEFCRKVQFREEVDQFCRDAELLIRES